MAFQSGAFQSGAFQSGGVTVTYRGDPYPGRREERYERENLGREDKKELRARIERAYAAIHAAPEAREEAKAIVKPFAKKPAKSLPPPSGINFTLLMRDVEAVERLLALAQQQEEEEAFFMLMFG